MRRSVTLEELAEILGTDVDTARERLDSGSISFASPGRAGLAIVDTEAMRTADSQCRRRFAAKFQRDVSTHPLAGHFR